MDKTNINALVQIIERSLDSIYKNRFSIEQYLIYKTFALTVGCTRNFLMLLSHSALDEGYVTCLSSAEWDKSIRKFCTVHSLLKGFLTSGKMPRS